MMKEWQAAREHVSEMRKTDNVKAEQLNKEITEVSLGVGLGYLSVGEGGKLVEHN